jgi:hypothetical protein
MISKKYNKKFKRGHYKTSTLNLPVELWDILAEKAQEDSMSKWVTAHFEKHFRKKFKGDSYNARRTPATSKAIEAYIAAQLLSREQ